jgi:hypothetical protein
MIGREENYQRQQVRVLSLMPVVLIRVISVWVVLWWFLCIGGGNPSSAIIRFNSGSTTAPRSDTAEDATEEEEKEDDNTARQSPFTPTIPRSFTPVDVILR